MAPHWFLKHRFLSFVLAICFLSAVRRTAQVLALVTSTNDVAALIVVDVQNCFTPGGSLAVADGDDVIPIINSIRERYNAASGRGGRSTAAGFDVVVTTMDWHCEDHVSFASQHPGYGVFSHVNLTYTNAGDLCTSDVTASSAYAVDCSGETESSRGVVVVEQTLWPDHCVMNTSGSKLHPRLATAPSDLVTLKGYRCQVDSYSAFFDNGGLTSTGLDANLRARNVSAVFITGLATDYCVYYTAKDAKRLGYRTHLIRDATRGIANDTVAAALADMKSRGILIIESADLQDIFLTSSAVGHLDPFHLSRPLSIHGTLAFSLLLTGWLFQGS